MAYATPDQLAKALHTRVTPENTAGLQSILDAAASEIDHYADRGAYDDTGSWVPDPILPGTDDYALAERVNLARAVEIAKWNDAAFGVIGFDETGSLRVPRDGFGRHAADLLPLKQHWGVA